jgi:hypothetical protein
MDFTLRKLPMEAASTLRICQIDTVKPFALMLAPVYVFMRRNEKYVSVKGPLDFFTPEELERLRTFETVFMPPFVDVVLPFRQVARRAKAILFWDPSAGGKSPLPPSPFELSDAILRVVGPLWSPEHRLEPFFVSVFANEFCDLLPGNELLEVRDRDLALYERGIFISSWMVFLSLHLGITDTDYLNALRLHSFRKVIGTEVSDEGMSPFRDELFELLDDLLADEAVYQPLGFEDFEGRSERVAQKLASRMKRVEESLTDITFKKPSIWGEKGFIHG